MGAANVSVYGSAGGLIRSFWPQKKIYETILEGSPTLGIARKDTSFHEEYRYITIGLGAPQGVGPDFNGSRNDKTPSGSKRFTIEAKTYYAFVSIQGRLLRMAEDDEAVLVKPVARESKNVILQVKRDFSSYIHGNGGGALGQISSGSNVSTQTITLEDTSRIRFFDEGMKLNADTTDGTSGTVHTGYVTIAAGGVDEDNGSITIEEASWVAAIPSIAASDYVFRRNVFGNVFTGLEGWNPSSLSGSSFMGVTRAAGENKKAGYRTTDTATMQPRAAAIRLARILADAQQDPNTYIIHTTDFENLQLELQSAGTLQYTTVPATAIGKFNFGIKYDAITIMGPRGPIAVLADADAPPQVGRMLDKSSLVLASTGDLLRPLKGRGPSDMRPEESADAHELGWVSDAQFYNENPRACARGTLIST
jgi:hypothetical protein